MATSTYYNEVVKTTEEFLGPAAERFVRRLVEFHLSKKPEDLDFDDIRKLKEPVGVALKLLTKDQKISDDAKRKFDKIKRI